MDHASHLATHQSPITALAGAWKLGARRAMTLRPREPGLLRVAHGRLWLTFDGPHAGALNESGDQVLDAGDALRLVPGQRLVIEVWDTREPAYFTWSPLPRARMATSPRWAVVRQPLADLRLALGFGTGAAVRLLRGLAGLLVGSAAPGCGGARARIGPAPACRAQGV